MCVHGTTGPEGQIEERRTAPQAEASRLEGMQRTGSQEELVHGPIEGSTVSLASDISVAADSTVMHRSDVASRESEATKLTKVSDVVRSLTDSIQTSLDTLAHDTHEKDDGLELMLDRARAILVSDVPIESVVSLFQAVDNYLATHQDRLFRQYKKDRLAVAKRLYDSLNQFLADKLAEKEKAKESEDGGSSTSSALSSMDIPSGIAKDQDELAKAKKGVKEFKKYYDSWREKLAGDVLRTPEEIIDAKLRLFEPYLDDLSKFKSLGETDKDFSFLYTEYRSLMMRKTMMQGKTSRNTKMEIAKEVAIQMDPELKDIEAGNKDMDQGVTEAQRAAVGQIDRWMIKNFNNGGMFGIKFDQSSFVSKILSLSVRERLYVYYLVETNKRKAPAIEDLFASQDAGYIPSLDTLKGKMTATKFKLGSYFSGKYVYWHKLTEAMQHLGNNRLLLEERYASFDEKEEETDLREEYLGSLEQEEEKIAGSTASAEKKESKQLKTDKQSYEINLTKRLDKLVELQKLLVILEKEKKKSEEKKEDKDHKAQKDVAGQGKTFDGFLADKIKVVAAEITDIDQAIRAYESGQNIEVAERKYSNLPATSQIGKEATTYPSKLADIIKQISSLAFNGAGGNGMSDFSLTAATIGGGIAAITSLIALSKKAGATNSLEITEEITGIVKSTLSAAKGTWKGVSIVKDGRKTVDGLLGSPTNPLQIAGYVTGGIEMAYGITTGAVAGYRKKKLSDARVFFADHHGEARAAYEANGGIPLTDEEKEAKFTDSMLKLSDRQRVQKRDKALFACAGGAVALTSAILPGIGTFALLPISASLGLSIGGTLVEKLKLGSFDRTVFDDYFNVEEISRQIIEEKQKNGEPLWRTVPGSSKTTLKNKEKYIAELKEQIRNQLAAEYGFNSVNGASEYIAHQYAVFIHKKIFAADADHNDPEWKAYESLLKSMGMKYNPEKMRPTVAELTKKMSGR